MHGCVHIFQSADIIGQNSGGFQTEDRKFPYFWPIKALMRRTPSVVIILPFKQCSRRTSITLLNCRSLPAGGRGSEKQFCFHGCINSDHTTHRIILNRARTYLIKLKDTFVLFCTASSCINRAASMLTELALINGVLPSRSSADLKLTIVLIRSDEVSWHKCYV